jgi:type II secretory pathway pseudopilin PulG
MIKPARSRGFTIIEVMIMVSIAGLILVIVFLAVPAMKRVQRNTERKQYIGLVFAEIEEFRNSHGNYPDSPADFCQFYEESTLRAANNGPGGVCNGANSGADQCYLITGNKYALCYHDNLSPHTYRGPYDQINIQHGHFCGTNPSNAAEYPISSNAAVPHNSLNRYVVWTPLENSGFACAGTE